jgi:hypothetical protein
MSIVAPLVPTPLPASNTTRWMASRKSAVVQAVNTGILSPQAACERYGLSIEELECWQRAVAQVGVAALRATRVQQYGLHITSA